MKQKRTWTQRKPITENEKAVLICYGIDKETGDMAISLNGFEYITEKGIYLHDKDLTRKQTRSIVVVI